METVLSPPKSHKEGQNEIIISRFKYLTEIGVGRNRAYNIIAPELIPPLDPATVSRRLKSFGLLDEPSKYGRPRKSDK